MSTFMLPERCKIVWAITPQAGAAINGDIVSLKGYRKCTIIVQVNHANAAAGAITVDKFTNVAGANISAGITMTNYWTNLDCAATDTLVKQAPAATFNMDAGITPQKYVIEVDAAELPDATPVIGNLYDCIRVNTGASNAGNITSAVYILHDSRYMEGTPPSAILD